MRFFYLIAFSLLALPQVTYSGDGQRAREILVAGDGQRAMTYQEISTQVIAGDGQRALSVGDEIDIDGQSYVVGIVDPETGEIVLAPTIQ